MSRLFFLVLLLVLASSSSSSAVEFLYQSFDANQLIFTGDATVEESVISLSKDSRDITFSMGRAFYPYPIIKRIPNTTISSFSTSFVFSIQPQSINAPGFGLAFVITNTTVIPGALAGQYFGLFNSSAVPSVLPLVVIEFDAGQNPEFNEPDGNHVGIDLNSIESIFTHAAGYYNSTGSRGDFVPVNLRRGSNIRAWIDFEAGYGINVTIAPAGIPRPSLPLISYRNPVIASYIDGDMFVGFSASRTRWIEKQRILAWSLSDEGTLKEINVTNLPSLSPDSPSSTSLSSGLIAGIVVICVVVMMIVLFGLYWFRYRNRGSKENDEEIQDWELEYWPHRFSYEELAQATKGFSKDELLGSGGFGKVFQGTLSNNTTIAVKCVNHNSNQGLREFMAEISSIGRLQHRNLVHMRGWCKKGQELLLVYEFMPNGSLYGWLFSKSRKMGWHQRLRVLMDVAEGLNYLHHGWDHLVLHRDIKSSNILLDSDMRGRVGDFGLAKLYKHGQAPSTTRLVGTIGYMAPELVKAGPTMASDVYSFGVLVLEVACGRRPTELWSEADPFFIDWVRKLDVEGRLNEAADWRIAGEYEMDDMEMVLKLGLECCGPNPQTRPKMKEVVSRLSTLMRVEGDLPSLSVSFSPGLQPGYLASIDTSTVVESLSVITEPGPRT